MTYFTRENPPKHPNIGMNRHFQAAEPHCPGEACFSVVTVPELSTSGCHNYCCISCLIVCGNVFVAKWANTLCEPQYLPGLTG